MSEAEKIVEVLDNLNVSGKRMPQASGAARQKRFIPACQ